MTISRLALLAVVPLLLAGCATDASEDTVAPTTDSFPLTLDNCDVEVTVDAAPERIVTIKSTATELVLALGAGDRIVGSAFADGDVPEEYADAAADIKILSDRAPSQEVVLETEPDLVFAGWESNLAADTAGERDTLAKLGVASYVAPSACDFGDEPVKMTFDLLFDHFTEAGVLLGETDAAADLVAAQRASLEDLGRVTDGTTALWWSSGEDTPFVGATLGAPQMVMDAIGLTNVVDVEDTWTSLGWESIVDSDPDVIVLVDSPWNSADAKMKTLESNAATAEMKAVKEKRYLFIPFPAAEAGVRSVGAAASLLTQATELGLAG